jgi:hypothetical protein
MIETLIFLDVVTIHNILNEVFRLVLSLKKITLETNVFMRIK